MFFNFFVLLFKELKLNKFKIKAKKMLKNSKKYLHKLNTLADKKHAKKLI